MRNQLKEKDALTYMKSGKSIVTIQSSKTGKHFTFRFAKPKDELDNKEYNGVYFIQLLSGQSNDYDYQYIGFMRDGKYFHGGSKTRVGENAQSVLSIKWVLKKLGRLNDQVKIFHEGSCGRCGRKLTEPESLKTGIGPVCRGLV